MNSLTLPCAIRKADELLIKVESTGSLKGKLLVSVRQDGVINSVCLSTEDEARLYQYLSERRGITPPAEPDALTRIAVALEALAPVADALTKLASYATEDGLSESARIP